MSRKPEGEEEPPPAEGPLAGPKPGTGGLLCVPFTQPTPAPSNTTPSPPPVHLYFWLHQGEKNEQRQGWLEEPQGAHKLHIPFQETHLPPQAGWGDGGNCLLFPCFPIPEEASFCLKAALHFLPLQLQSSGGQQGGLLALFLPQHRTWTQRPWAREGPSERRCPAKANTGFRRILSFFFFFPKK